jgi:hypothetical protein
MSSLFAVDDLGQFIVVGSVVTIIVGAVVAGYVAIIKILWGYIQWLCGEHAKALAQLRKDMMEEHEAELGRLGFLSKKTGGSA